MNIVCVICSDLLVPSDDVFHTPCGHVFHHACLLQWIERSHTCPQCRQRTTESKIHRIYFNFSNNESILEDPVSLQTRIDSLNFQLKLKQKDVDDLKGENEKLGKQTSGLRHEVRKIENKIVSKDSVIFALNDQIKFFKQECSDMKNYKEENIQLKKELENLKCIRSLVDESVSKLDSIIMETSDTFKLKTYIAVLKREMMVTSDRCKEIRERYNNLRHQYSRVTGDNKALAEERVKRKKLEEQLILCESEKMSLEVKLHKMQQNELNCIDSDLSLKSLSNSNRQEKHNTVKKSNTVNDCMPKSKSASALNDTSGSSDNWIIVNNDNNITPQNIKSQGFFSIESDMKKQEASSSNIKVPSILAKKSRFNQHSQRTVANREMSFDGFGGHAKCDNFPNPISPALLKKSKEDLMKLRKRKLEKRDN